MEVVATIFLGVIAVACWRIAFHLGRLIDKLCEHDEPFAETEPDWSEH